MTPRTDRPVSMYLEYGIHSEKNVSGVVVGAVFNKYAHGEREGDCPSTAHGDGWLVL